MAGLFPGFSLQYSLLPCFYLCGFMSYLGRNLTVILRYFSVDLVQYCLLLMPFDSLTSEDSHSV